MILIACIDIHGGMLFGGRRQSQDRGLRARILALTAGKRLWMHPYTRKQFTEPGDNITADENCLEKAQPGEYCFVENLDPLPYEAKLEAIILYHWNRDYPADFHFSIPLTAHGWKCVQRSEFPGSSHAVITEEVYQR